MQISGVIVAAASRVTTRVRANAGATLRDPVSSNDAKEYGIRASTRPVLLLGDPVEHSLSPALHNAAFRAQGLDRVYLACRVASRQLGDALRGALALGAVGANITVPHKEAVFADINKHPDWTMSEAAKATGAVNTLIRTTKGLWHADNTDVQGVVEPLTPHVAALSGREAVVLGAGGAARAVVYALLRRGVVGRVTVAARRPKQAERLVEDLERWSGTTALCATSWSEAPVASARLVVNATPVGMHPHAGTTPWPGGTWRPEHIAYDLIYRPSPTRFLREAAAAKATTIGGLSMLLGQAAVAYQQWTGRVMPRDVARAAAERHLPP